MVWNAREVSSVIPGVDFFAKNILLRLDVVTVRKTMYNIFVPFTMKIIASNLTSVIQGWPENNRLPLTRHVCDVHTMNTANNMISQLMSFGLSFQIIKVVIPKISFCFNMLSHFS